MAPRIALVAALAALWCGAAAAQDDGAVCRGFCDAEATRCRKDVAEDFVLSKAPPLVPMTVNGAVPSPSHDFIAEKKEQADRSADDERFRTSQRCGDTRQACRQRCEADAAARAASASSGR